VLYVNHTATVGGGERSLLDLLSALPGDVSPVLACPVGDLQLAASRLGVPTTPIPEAAPSFRLDPVQTPRGLLRLGHAAISVRRAARRAQADLIHANSVRAGLIAAPPLGLAAAPVVVHIRDCLPHGKAALLARRAIGSGAAIVIANSGYTAASFGLNGAHPPVRTIHNFVDVSVFDPKRIDRSGARARLGLAAEAATLGVVAQLTPWKAQDDAIRMLAALRRSRPDVRLLLVGSAKFARGTETLDNLAFERSLHALARDLGVEEAVDFLGERQDVAEILRALDIALVPSWQEPFGRSVIEAMAMETPVIATVVGGPREIVGDGVDGVLLPPREPERWAETAGDLLDAPERLRAMGEAGRRTALARFGREAHVQSVLAAYREVLGGEAG
jgi:glycosyltransferase involved in cell wall biosynthesis